VQTADEVSRRLLDAISREPSFRLMPQGTPLIQAVPQAATDGAAQPSK